MSLNNWAGILTPAQLVPVNLIAEPQVLRALVVGRIARFGELLHLFLVVIYRVFVFIATTAIVTAITRCICGIGRKFFVMV